MDGGACVAEVLKAQGVRQLYTLCGGHIAPILVAAKRLGIDILDTRHEVNAVFAADASFRLTGVPGVAAVTAGPGVSNTLTAIKNAALAQSAVVVIGGATATMLKGRGALQDIDQMALVREHVKWTAAPKRLRHVGPALEQAFRESLDGIPGPVFVELPVDLLYDESVVRDWYKNKTDKPDPSLSERALAVYLKTHLRYLFGSGDAPTPGPRAEARPVDARSLRSDARAGHRMLSGARRPVLVLGSQAVLDPAGLDALIAAIEKLSMPTYLSGMARGLLGPDHPLQLRHKRRNALKEADLVLLAGVPCDFRLDYGAHVARAKLIAANLSEDDLFKNRRPDLAVHESPGAFLTALADQGSASPEEGWHASLEARDAAREEEIEGQAQEAIAPVHPLRFLRALDRALDDDSVLIGDGGDFVATASYVLRPRGPLRWLDPGVFGTLGVGAGFALAAKQCRPSAEVWLLYGDGAAGFSLMEMDSLVRHKRPVIAVVGNDGAWAQIERDQSVILGDDVGTQLGRMAYHAVAEGCGAKGILIDQEDQIPGALAQAKAWAKEGHSVLVNVHIGRSDFRKGSISI